MANRRYLKSKGKVRRNRKYTAPTSVNRKAIITPGAKGLLEEYNAVAPTSINKADIMHLGTGANGNILQADLQKYLNTLPQHSMSNHKYAEGVYDLAVSHKVTCAEINRRSDINSPITKTEIENIVSGRL